MYRIIRDHNKKLMAFFAVGLMVAFLLETAVTRNAGTNTGDSVRAHMGNQPITIADFQRADADWEILSRDVSTYTSLGELPLIVRIGNPSMQQLALLTGRAQPYQLPGVMPAAVRVVNNPQTFLLLLKEAIAAGIQISEERLDQEMATQVRVRGTLGEREKARVREAVRDLMLIEASYDRVANLVKVSEPIVTRDQSSQAVQISADVVTISTLPAGIPTTASLATTLPTDEALQKQFEAYADMLPGTVTSNNPFGFGYKLPDRAKVQTLAISREAIKSAVEKTRTPQKWDVEARAYFYRNPAEFPSTAPSSQPATAPASRSFDDLSTEQKTEAMEKVMRPEISSLYNRIRTYLVDRMARDYTAAKPSTQPSTATTAPSSGFTSYGYLEDLALDVQKQFGVLPIVATRADWVDAESAVTLKDIGTARMAGGVSFGEALFQSQPFVDGNAATAALKLYEFSPPLSQFGDDIYMFRLVDAQRSHRAPSIAEVRTAVYTDLMKKNAVDAAQAAADKLAEAAKESTLADAAKAQGQTVKHIGPVSPADRFSPVTGIDLPDTARNPFLRSLNELRASATHDSQGRPLGTITPPNASEIYVVNITAAPVDESTSMAASMGLDPFTIRLQTMLQTENQISGLVQNDWFSFEGVSKRIDYKGDAPRPSARFQ